MLISTECFQRMLIKDLIPRARCLNSSHWNHDQSFILTSTLIPQKSQFLYMVLITHSTLNTTLTSEFSLKFFLNIARCSDTSVADSQMKNRNVIVRDWHFQEKFRFLSVTLLKFQWWATLTKIAILMTLISKRLNLGVKASANVFWIGFQ